MTETDGINLVIGTTTADPTGWKRTGWSGSFTSFDPLDHVYKLTTTNGWTQITYDFSDHVDEELTISGYIKIDPESTNTDVIVLDSVTTSPESEYAGGVNASSFLIEENDVEVYFHFTETITEAKPRMGLWIRAKTADAPTGNLIVYIRNLKVERGGVPTPWTPAPEDPMVIARSDEITVVRVNDGAKGETGATGKGVKAITPQYYLSTSNTSCTGGTWQNTEPEYVSGRYYWTRSKIVWTDNSTTYTSAVLAEGVNNANQSAESANETANSAQDTANDAQNTANNAAADAEAAQSAANNAQQTADSAQQAAENANAVAGEAHQAALEAQAASDKANELASGATAGLQQISQVFYADSTGAHVKAANDNETVIQSDGMHVMVGDDEVARFTKDDSHVDNLAVGRFLMFGAHRAEVYEDGGEVGTGFFWVGDVQ